MEELQKSGLFNAKGNLIFFAHRIIIPYLHNGNITYLRGRYFDENGNTKTDRSKYIGLGNDAIGINTSKRLFNIDVLKKMLPEERLYITEGEFDCIVMEGMGYNAVCIPGVGNMPSERILSKLDAYDIYLCLDTDTAGEGLATLLITYFSGRGKVITKVKLPVKDVTDFVNSI